MITSISYGAIAVLAAFLSNVVSKSQHKTKSYLLIFLAVLIFSLLIGEEKAHAMVVPNHISAICREHNVGYVPEHALTRAQIQKAEQERDMYKKNAERCFKDAQDACWWLPNTSDRKKTRELFTITVNTMLASDVKSKLIAMLTTSLIFYGMDCLDEWEYINNKLFWARYHWEMYEFHVELIAKAHLL